MPQNERRGSDVTSAHRVSLPPRAVAPAAYRCPPHLCSLNGTNNFTDVLRDLPPLQPPSTPTLSLRAAPGCSRHSVLWQGPPFPSATTSFSPFAWEWNKVPVCPWLLHPFRRSLDLHVFPSTFLEGKWRRSTALGS